VVLLEILVPLVILVIQVIRVILAQQGILGQQEKKEIQDILVLRENLGGQQGILGHLVILVILGHLEILVPQETLGLHYL
jgi:hypothetical protein